MPRSWTQSQYSGRSPVLMGSSRVPDRQPPGSRAGCFLAIALADRIRATALIAKDNLPETGV